LSYTTNLFSLYIQDASKCDLYSDHATQTTVAKYSPSRFYIASGGKVNQLLCLSCVIVYTNFENM